MLVPFGGTGINRPPDQSILYSSCRRNSLQPWPRIARLNPVFGCRFLLNFCLRLKGCSGFQQPGLVLMEAVERLDEVASRQCGEANHAPGDPCGRGRRMDWLLSLALGRDRA